MIPRLDKKELTVLARLARTQEGAFLKTVLGQTLENAKDSLVFEKTNIGILQGRAQAIQELMQLLETAEQVK